MFIFNMFNHIWDDDWNGQGWLNHQRVLHLPTNSSFGLLSRVSHGRTWFNSMNNPGRLLVERDDGFLVPSGFWFSHSKTLPILSNSVGYFLLWFFFGFVSLYPICLMLIVFTCCMTCIIEHPSIAPLLLGQSIFLLVRSSSSTPKKWLNLHIKKLTIQWCISPSSFFPIFLTFPLRMNALKSNLWFRIGSIHELGTQCFLILYNTIFGCI